MRVFAEEVSLRARELKFRIFPQLFVGFSCDDQLQALQSGKLDLAVVLVVHGVKKIPEFSLTLLPAFIPDLAVARDWLDTPSGQEELGPRTAKETADATKGE